MAPRGYDLSIAVRARELRDAGWGPLKIRDLLDQELGIRPGVSTIQRWTNPHYAERYRKSQLVKPWRRPFARLRELDAAGLPHKWIALLLNHDFGLDLGESNVRNLAEGDPRPTTLDRLLTPPKVST